MDGIKVLNNLQDGLGILYSDIYSADAVNTVRNSEFSNNRGSGISFKQLGLTVTNSRLENNRVAGIRHNPALSAVQQREFAGWFERLPDVTVDTPYNPIIIPHDSGDIELASGETKYVVTAKGGKESLRRLINIQVSNIDHFLTIKHVQFQACH